MPSEQAEAVKALLVDLFPRLSGALGHSNYGSDWLPRWSRERRISSPEYCPRYFSYAVPRNDIPDAIITGLLDASTNGEEAAVEASLTTHLAGPKARRVIEKLRAIESTIDPNAAEILAVIIATLGKNIPNPPALFDFAEPPSQAAILISHLLRRIPDRSRRIGAAKRVMGTADPLWFGVECIRWLYVTDKPEKQDSNTLTGIEISEVRRVLVDRIKSYAAAGAPLFNPDVSQEKSLLFEWWRAEGRDPVQHHLVGVFERDATQVGRFLQSQVPLAWSEGAVLPRVSELGADQLKNMKLIIDLATLAEWIRKHCPGNFENPEWYHDDTTPVNQQLAEQFMFVYTKWTKDGEPPDPQRSNDDGGGDTKRDEGVNDESQASRRTTASS